MNNELAMRTLAYLITHYKEHDETIINSEEIQAIEFLQQENKELNQKYLNAVADYETTTSELQELKKQLEDMTLCRDIASGHRKEVQDRETILLNQQKEFIEYLEDLIKQNETVVEVSKYGLPKNCSKLLIDFYKEILSKYKEITGQQDGQVSGQV